MSLSTSDLKLIYALPCFDEIIYIELLNGGLSHTCMKVTTTTQAFFVKKLNKNSSSNEALISHTVSINAHFSQLSPQVIYTDNNWLVTEFVEAKPLTSLYKTEPACIDISLDIMVKLHTLPAANNLPILDIKQSIHELISKLSEALPEKLAHLNTVALSVADKLSLHTADSNPDIVLCHGDVNYTNILIDNKSTSWLIDFECASLAPREFDLAMFIAVNNLSIAKIKCLILQYEKLTSGVKLDSTLLTYYLLYSYFINGLWYFDRNNKPDKKAPLCSLGLEQWRAFDCFAKSQCIDIPLLSNLLPIS